MKNPIISTIFSYFCPPKTFAPRALAALCHGALKTQRRALVLPLLEQLRAALATEPVRGEEAVELLAAAAERRGSKWQRPKFIFKGDLKMI